MIKRLTLLLIVVFAFSACGKSLAKRKEESGTHYRLGVVHLNDKNITDALKELTVAIDIYDEDPTYHNAIGLAYFARGMNKEAIEHLKTAIKLDPKFPESHVNIAAVYSVEKRWDEVISESKIALSDIFYRTPELAYFNMGWAYHNKGDYNAALESFRNAIKNNPDYYQAYYNMGLTLDKLNDMKGSVSAFEKAISLNGAYVEAYYSLGLANIKLKDKAAAEKAFQKVMELQPQGELTNAARDYMNLIK